MIPKISGSGTSFKGLAVYLTHDPKASTNERVAWTHTLNLGNDHIPSAVHEMYVTAENAESIKQQAGVRAGGRATKNPVKHISLNWAPDDNPSQEHMIATSQDYLRHMGWHEHQAILIAHDDKTYKHVHIMLNAVHPETGLRLNESYEQRRSQAWALEYEREQNRIHCEQRVRNESEREANMPRHMWMAFKANEQEFSRAEKILTDNSPEIPENPKNAEWKRLKEIQRDQRDAFLERGKLEYSELRSEVFHEVKEEFRPRWAEYYKARKNGLDAESLAEMKAQLTADQKAMLEPLRDQACRELRESRNEQYRELLDAQKEDRIVLGWRQDLGLDVAPFLQELEERRAAGQNIERNFVEAGQEIASNHQTRPAFERHDPDAGLGDDVGAGSAVGFGPTRGLASGVASFADSLFFDLTMLGSAKPVPVTAQEKADIFREAAENTLKQHQQRGREEDDEAWRERQKDLFGE